VFEAAGISRVRVSVNTTALASMYLPAGDVWDWARKVALDMEIEAIAIAPFRTGALKLKHGTTTTPIGRYQVRATVHNDADYAAFVHDGTSTIRANMIVRPFPHSYYPRPWFRDQVRGQPPQPWLDEAKRTVLFRYGL
jgi:hypothetical protein